MTLEQIKTLKHEAQRLLIRACEAEKRIEQEISYRSKQDWYIKKGVGALQTANYTGYREISALKRSLLDLKYVGAKINNPNLYQ